MGESVAVIGPLEHIRRIQSAHLVQRQQSRDGAHGQGHQENRDGWTPLAITKGIHRGMNIVSSRETEVAIQKLLDSL